MSSSFVWMIVGMGVVTYLTRFPALWMGAKKSLNGRLVKSFMLAPLGIFTALSIPPLFIPEEEMIWEPSYLFGGLAAAYVAWRTKQPLWAMVGGVFTVALFRWVLKQ